MDDSDGHQHGANGFAHGAEHGHQHYPHGARATADGHRRVEVITGLERRRRWPPELKAQITAESLVPGANVSRVARLHGVSIGLLHYWRRCARDSASDEEMRFVPVLPAPSSLGGPAQPGASIEIDYGGVRIRMIGTVDATALRTVMAVVRSGA